MASIMTNASALTALQSLATTNKLLETTQARISTGYRVSTATDNAAYWSIATTMKSDNSSLSTVQDALGLGSAFVDVAYTAIDQAKLELSNAGSMVPRSMKAAIAATTRPARTIDRTG